jgi:hypothetical protein
MTWTFSTSPCEVDVLNRVVGTAARFGDLDAGHGPPQTEVSSESTAATGAGA